MTSPAKGRPTGSAPIPRFVPVLLATALLVGCSTPPDTAQPDTAPPDTAQPGTGAEPESGYAAPPLPAKASVRYEMYAVAPEFDTE